VAVTLKKETAIETRKISGMAQARIWNALIVLGSMLMLARWDFPGTYHHTELKDLWRSHSAFLATFGDDQRTRRYG
jgi:lipoate-protein ligase A